MNALNRRTVYGKIVPALAILLGLSYAFIDSDAVRRVLLFALVAAAALGWLAPHTGSSAECDARQQRRDARHELRVQRRAARLGTPQPGQGGQPGQLTASGQPNQPGQPQHVGPVLDGIPQDTIHGERPQR